MRKKSNLKETKVLLSPKNDNKLKKLAKKYKHSKTQFATKIVENKLLEVGR